MCQGCPKALIKECSLHQNAPQLSWLWLKSVAWSNVSRLSYCFELRVWNSSKYITVVLWLWLKSVALVKGITVVLQLRLEAALVKCTKAVLRLWLKNITSLACWRVPRVCVWSLTELTWVWIDSLTQFSELTWVQIYSLIELHTHTRTHCTINCSWLYPHTHTLYYEHTHTKTKTKAANTRSLWKSKCYLMWIPGYLRLQDKETKDHGKRHCREDRHQNGTERIQQH